MVQACLSVSSEAFCPEGPLFSPGLISQNVWVRASSLILALFSPKILKWQAHQVGGSKEKISSVLGAETPTTR